MIKSKNKISEDQFTDRAWRFGETVFKLFLNGVGPFLEQLLASPLKIPAIICGIYFAIFKVTMNVLHLKFLAWAWPSLFSGKFLAWFYHVPAKYHYNGAALTLLTSYVMFLGANAIKKRRRLKEKFEAIGLVNRFAQAPKLIHRGKVDDDRERLVLNAMAIGIDQFQSKKGSLESAFGERIESIHSGQDLRNVEIVFTTKEIPTFVDFNELLERSPLDPGWFYLGDSETGVLKANMSTLPHLLVAGTTGAGKSIFFKQALLGLLKSGSELQVYFIDLKRGLEAVDFKSAKVLASIKERINKKPFGRAIRDGEIIARAISQLTEEDIVQLQDASYTERDRLHMAHADYARQNGKISLDEFIGRLIRGEIMPLALKSGRT